MDPFLVAVGLVGNRELTDELLNEVLAMLPLVAKGITEAELTSIRKQLESTIGVSMMAGQGLHDEEIAPWLGEIKATTQWHYWDAYVKHLKSKNFGKAVLRVLDEDTDGILNECGNPAQPGPWQSKGLVMGDVQSGKTANYCGLINKAADTGYMVIVLLTGMLEDLRTQSQERLDEGFVGRDSRQLMENGRAERVIGAGRFKDKIPNVLTSIDSDFLTSNHRAIGGIPLVNIREPVLLVMKKNKSPLSNLISFLDSQLRGRPGKLDMPLLLVDDEADNASVNAKKDEDPATINKLIRELISRFSKVSYVGYTATPFANVFINPDIDDLFPSNFVYSLNTPTNYLGVASFFSEAGTHKHCVQDIDDAEDLLPYSHKKNHSIASLPPSLWDAVRVFLLSCAIRDLRHEPLKHRSMLVNATRFTDVQGRVSGVIKDRLYELSEDIKQYLASERWADHPSLRDLHLLWETHYAECEIEWDAIRKNLYESISTVAVVTVNQKSNDSERLNYAQYAGSRFGRRVIAVGGMTLSRGLTLEGLCVSYFYRNSKAYDTLLQMGRWFGYRPGYDDLCRLWVDPLASDWYAHLSDVVDELRYDIRRMHANRLPPSQFGMRVQSHPDALIITALTKMRNADNVQVAISYSGFGAETPLLPDDIDRNEANLKLVADFVEDLGIPTRSESAASTRATWKNIGKERIAAFLKSLEILDLNAHFIRDHATGTKPLLDFISSNTATMLDRWEVCLPQGIGSEVPEITPAAENGSRTPLRARTRQFEKVRTGSGFLRLNKQRVGDSSDELVGLAKSEHRAAVSEWETERRANEKLGASMPDYFLRKFRSCPLLTIHVIQPAEPSENAKNAAKMMRVADIRPTSLVAIGISFPQFDGETQHVVYSLNKVALRAAGLLMEEEDGQDED